MKEVKNMKKAILRYLLPVIGLMILSGCENEDAPFDLVISGGRIIDGTGNPWFYADVGVRGGKIIALGDLDGKKAQNRVDATGKIVSPGFIDLHSHADDRSGSRSGLRSDDVRRRQAVNIVTQGSTTVVVNPDGSGAAGLSIAGQRAQLEKGGIGLNVALMVGHNAVREEVMKEDARRLATPQEITDMRALIRQAMEEGAFGLTSGLEYFPGRWSNTAELVALMEEAAPYKGVHISHMRSETTAPMWWVPSQHAANPPQLLDAVSEIIEIAERTGTRGVSSHMKVRGITHWGQSKQVIELIEAARARGVEMYGDQYPYNSSGSDGRIRFIPKWSVAAKNDTVDYPTALRATLEDGKKKAALYGDIRHALAFRGGAENVVVFDYPDKSYIGRSLKELAQTRSISEIDMVIALQLEGYADRRGGGRLRSFSLAEEDIERIMAQSWVATSSDGGVSLPEDGPAIHARYYGTFARKIAHFARDRGAVTLEHAVRAGTSLPAQILGLKDRGTLREGFAADIVVFDYNEIKDTATFTDPHQYAEGVEHVWVGGVAVVKDGKATHALPGKVLRP